MKQCYVLFALALTILVATPSCTRRVAAQSTKSSQWFAQKDWLGRLSWQPHSSINQAVLEEQYTKHKTYWDKAFAFLANTDLQQLAPGRYNIDGDNVYASVTHNATKDKDSTQWESHKDYIDLQSVIAGDEIIGVSPVEKLSVTMPYNAAKDLINYKGDGVFYTARPGTFFLFFPSDGHRPNITTGAHLPDKKVVVKIRYAP